MALVLFFVIQVFFFFLQCDFIYLCLTVLGLHYCVQALSSCGERGLPFVMATGFSLWWLLVEYGLACTGFGSRGTQAQRLSSQARAQGQ